MFVNINRRNSISLGSPTVCGSTNAILCDKYYTKTKSRIWPKILNKSVTLLSGTKSKYRQLKSLFQF